MLRERRSQLKTPSPEGMGTPKHLSWCHVLARFTQHEALLTKEIVKCSVTRVVVEVQPHIFSDRPPLARTMKEVSYDLCRCGLLHKSKPSKKITRGSFCTSTYVDEFCLAGIERLPKS